MKEELAEESDASSTPKKKKSRAKTTFKCKVCKNVYSKDLHASHMATHSGMHKCHICQNEFGTRKYMLRHVRNVHTEKKYKYKCSVCDMRFAYENRRKQHEMIHTGEKPYECEDCGKTFRAQYCYKMHLLVHSDERPFKCLYCPYSCRDSSTLRKHHERHTGQGPQYQCTKCDKKYKLKYRLKVHVAEEHLCLNVRLTECEHCDKKFKNRSQLSAHIRSVHERAKVAKCEICGKFISNYANMPAHLRTHTTLKPYNCPETSCNMIFRTEGDAKKHSVIHCPRRKTPCIQCGRRFARVSALRRHELTQHLPKVKDTGCEICGAKFYNDNYLLKHIHQKHSSLKERYECDHCGLVTMNKPSIVMHLKYGHGNEKDLKCKICKRKYKRHVYLKMHYLKSHNVRYKPIQRKKKKPPPPRVEVTVKEEPLDIDIEDHDLDGALENAEIVNAEDIASFNTVEEYDSSMELSESVANTIIAENVAELASLPEKIFDEFYIKHIKHNDGEREQNIKIDKEALEENRVRQEKEREVEEARQSELQECLERVRQGEDVGAGQKTEKEKGAGKVPVLAKRLRRIYARCEMLLSCDICDREFHGLAALKGHLKMHSNQNEILASITGSSGHHDSTNSNISEPTTYTKESKGCTSAPNCNTVEPESNTSETVSDTSEPRSDDSNPKSDDSNPKSYTVEPESNTSEPKSNTSEPRTVTSNPKGHTSEPVSDTSDQNNYTDKQKSCTSEPKTCNTRAPEIYTTETRTVTSNPKGYTSEPLSDNSDQNNYTDEPNTYTSEPKEVRTKKSNRIKNIKRHYNAEASVKTKHDSDEVPGSGKSRKSCKTDRVENLKVFYDMNVKDLGIDFEQFVKICKKVKKDGSSE